MNDITEAPIVDSGGINIIEELSYEQVADGHPAAVMGFESGIHEAEQRLSSRFDRNFVIVEKAIHELQRQLKRPPKIHHRTGAAARINPDDYRAGRIIIALTVVFASASAAASFSGQIAMAPWTALPVYLYFVVPLAIDLPVAYLSWMAMIYRRRKQGAKRTWALLISLTIVSSIVNIVHVLSFWGVLAGKPLTIEIAVGTTIMGIMPLLVLISWEELARLVVKPTGETREVTPEPEIPVIKITPRRAPATRKKK